MTSQKRKLIINKLYPGYQTTKNDKCREKAKGDLIILPPHVATTSPVGKRD